MQQATPFTAQAQAPVPVATPQTSDAQINPNATSENAREALSAPATAANSEDASAAIEATSAKLGVDAGDSTLPPATLSSHAAAPIPAQAIQPDTQSPMQRESKLKPETEQQIMDMAVFSSKSEQIDFKELIQPTEAFTTVLVAFIRHFYCASCQQYVQKLAAEAPASRLAKSNAKLVVIGQGDASLIEAYKKVVGNEYEIYTQPSRALYKALGMVVNFDISEESSYVKPGFFTGLKLAAKNAMTMGSIASPGNYKQNGGEYVWIDNVCTFAHNMTSTNDHAPVEVLMRQANVA